MEDLVSRLPQCTFDSFLVKIMIQKRAILCDNFKSYLFKGAYILITPKVSDVLCLKFNF